LKCSALAFALATAAFGCREASTYPGFDAAVDAPAFDGASADANTDVMRADSGCPAPARITPEMVPADYLPVQRVTFMDAIDGDTAHFAVPITGRTSVRFLWVNAEEISGAERTAFGARTAQEVARIMSTGTLFQLAKRRARPGSDQPELDMFGRTLALVFMDGDLFQTRLVREGWSAYYTGFGCPSAPLHETLLHAEAEARTNRVGIWAHNHPTNYATVLAQWIGTRGCRPNPFRNQPYCN
jgi:endonuclease YncB( thermonuclease family)